MQVLKGIVIFPQEIAENTVELETRAFVAGSEEGRLFSQATNYDTQQKKKVQDQKPSRRAFCLNNEAQNRQQAFFQIILGNTFPIIFFLPEHAEDCVI